MDLIRRSRARLTAGGLAEFELFAVVLKDEPHVTPNPYDAERPQLAMIWVTEDGTDTWIWEWATLTLNPRPDGAPSRLHEILTAAAGRPASDEVEWFDPASMRFSFDGAAVAGALSAGTRVLVRGRFVTGTDGRTHYRILSHESAGGGSGACVDPGAHPPALIRPQLTRGRPGEASA